jgi:VWFA-related protein
MKRRTAIKKILVAGAVSVLCPRLPGDSDFVIRSDVRLVLLDVSVKDREGGFTAGLSKDNFRVEENGDRQPITVFANNDIPVTVGILVDNSRSMAPKRAEVLSAATAFIEGSNPQDEIFVLNFNDTVRRGLPGSMMFSDDATQLRAALSRGIPEGRTALNDAIMDGLQQLGHGKRDKKTLVIISDGGDNASHRTRRQMWDAVERDIATIYTIGLFDTDDPDRNPAMLRRLAGITGGQSYFPESAQGLTAACRGIARDIRTRYTLGYHPPPKNGSAARHIRVRVSVPGRPHLIARTRTSYLYQDSTGGGQ